jgi:hypothetical protein
MNPCTSTRRRRVARQRPPELVVGQRSTESLLVVSDASEEGEAAALLETDRTATHRDPRRTQAITPKSDLADRQDQEAWRRPPPSLVSPIEVCDGRDDNARSGQDQWLDQVHGRPSWSAQGGLSAVANVQRNRCRFDSADDVQPAPAEAALAFPGAVTVSPTVPGRSCRHLEQGVVPGEVDRRQLRIAISRTVGRLPDRRQIYVR